MDYDGAHVRLASEADFEVPWPTSCRQHQVFTFLLYTVVLRVSCMIVNSELERCQSWSWGSHIGHNLLLAAKSTKSGARITTHAGPPGEISKEDQMEEKVKADNARHERDFERNSEKNLSVCIVPLCVSMVACMTPLDYGMHFPSQSGFKTYAIMSEIINTRLKWACLACATAICYAIVTLKPKSKPRNLVVADLGKNCNTRIVPPGSSAQPYSDAYGPTVGAKRHDGTLHYGGENDTGRRGPTVLSAPDTAHSDLRLRLSPYDCLVANDDDCSNPGHGRVSYGSDSSGFNSDCNSDYSEDSSISIEKNIGRSDDDCSEVLDDVTELRIQCLQTRKRAEQIEKIRDELELEASQALHEEEQLSLIRFGPRTLPPLCDCAVRKRS